MTFKFVPADINKKNGHRQFRKYNRPGFIAVGRALQCRIMENCTATCSQSHARCRRTCISSDWIEPQSAFLSPEEPDFWAHICVKGCWVTDNQVLCLDNFSTGHSRNIRHLRRNPAFTVLRHDVVEPFVAEVDEIYNLACPASPPDYQADPIHTMKTSVLGALNLLELAKDRGARIFQASTSEVYGDPHVHPQPESYWGNVNPVRSALLLRRGQALRRNAVLRLPPPPRRRDQDRANLQHLRTAHAAGRRPCRFQLHRPGAAGQEDITIYGDGSQTRSFCFVDDLIDGFLRLMNSGPAFTGPVNLGNPGEFTIRELADLVIELTGSRSRIVHLPLPVDDPRQRRPDISLASKELGWDPSAAAGRSGEDHRYFDRLLSLRVLSTRGDGLMSAQRVLVTGGAGYHRQPHRQAAPPRRHRADRLRQSGHRPPHVRPLGSLRAGRHSRHRLLSGRLWRDYRT